MTDHGGPNDPVSPPKAEFAFPGPLRDQLVGAILEGDKTTMTALLLEYERAHEPLPAVGARFVLVNSEDRPVAVLEVTNVRLARLVEVDLAHVRDEGEINLHQSREAHEDFCHSQEMRTELRDPAFIVDDTTQVVLERFRVVERIDP